MARKASRRSGTKEGTEYNFSSIAGVVTALGNRTLVGPHDNKKAHTATPIKLGLVFSGGGARGAFEAGVLEETLRECERVGFPHRPQVVIGTSTGSMNSYAYLLTRMQQAGIDILPDWVRQDIETGPEGNKKYQALPALVWNLIGKHNRAASYAVDKPWLVWLLNCSAWLRWVLVGLVALILVLLVAFVGLPTCNGSDLAKCTVVRIQPLTLIGILLLNVVCSILLCLGLFQLAYRLIRGRGWVLLYTILACLGSLVLFALLCQGTIALFGKVMALRNTVPLLSGFFALVSLVAILWGVSGDAMFNNARLKRLLASLVKEAGLDENCLKNPVSTPAAERSAARASAALAEAYYKHRKKVDLPTVVFTAADVIGQKQCLFTLGANDEELQRLARHEDWLPFVFHGEGVPKARAKCRRASLEAADLVRCVVASTTISAIYPGAIFSFDYFDGEGNTLPSRQAFVDGGLLDFCAYHVAIDLGCTHILTIETNAMQNDHMLERWQAARIDLLTCVARTAFTGVDVESREDAHYLGRINRMKLYQGLKSKQYVKLIRIVPRYHEIMIDSEEFDGRYKNGDLKQSLCDWYDYGRFVNPAVKQEKLHDPDFPKEIWYRDANYTWAKTSPIQGPVLWEASFYATPQQYTRDRDQRS